VVYIQHRASCYYRAQYLQTEWGVETKPQGVARPLCLGELIKDLGEVNPQPSDNSNTGVTTTKNWLPNISTRAGKWTALSSAKRTAEYDVLCEEQKQAA
jgi:hypothetical protein